MPYPGETFITAFGPALSIVAQELRQYYALVQGWLSADHLEDGTHGNIRGRSLTLTANTATGATGNLSADGTGDFDGNVTADADGDPVIIGGFGAGIGQGIDLRNGTTIAKSRWQIVAIQTSTARTLRFIDVLEATLSRVFDIHQRASGGSGSFNYYLTPTSTVGLSLGQNASGARLDEVNTGTSRSTGGYNERLRTAAMGEWTAYTPTWGASGGAPSLGNGTLAARYMQVGLTVFYDIQLTGGSTTTFGTGEWTFTLPVTANDTTGQAGTAFAVDPGNAYHTGAAFLASTTTLKVAGEGGTSTFTSLAPFTWGNGDSLRLSGFYIIP
jgi:hypothetical protein